MTGQPIPKAPPQYDAQQIQQAFQTFETRLSDLEEQQNRIWKVTTKKIDETRNTDGATLADDAELFFTVEANKTYRFRFMVWFDTSAAADFKFTVQGPTSPTKVRITHAAVATDATIIDDIDVETAFNFGPIAVTGAAGSGWVWVEGILQNGDSDGGVYLKWAQNTSNASDTVVLAGSYVQYGQA